jgi:hypothetical protein
MDVDNIWRAYMRYRAVWEQLYQGEIGDGGGPGTAATITVGTTTTGLPGTSANVVNVGTPSAAILNFTIPRGNVGPQGDQGDPGVAGVYVNTTPPATLTGGELRTTAGGSVFVYNGTSHVWVQII